MGVITMRHFDMQNDLEPCNDVSDLAHLLCLVGGEGRMKRFTSAFHSNFRVPAVQVLHWPC